MSSTSSRESPPRGRLALDALDPPVEHRAHEHEDLPDDLGELRAQLGRQEVADRGDDGDERVDLVVGLARPTAGRPSPPAAGARVAAIAHGVLGEPLGRLLRGLAGARGAPAAPQASLATVSTGASNVITSA